MGFGLEVQIAEMCFGGSECPVKCTRQTYIECEGTISVPMDTGAIGGPWRLQSVAVKLIG